MGIFRGAGRFTVMTVGIGKEEVFRLDVSVEVTMRMESLYAADDLGAETADGGKR